jgi:chemotaxis protein MotB
MKPQGAPLRGGGQDRWLLSYADFVTLLFAVFVSMYAVSTVDADKLEPAASSFRVAFEGETQAAGPMPLREGGALLTEPAPAKLDDVRSELSRQLADAIAAGRLDLIQDGRGLVVSLPESATFAPASTEVTDGARELIARVAAAVEPFGHSLRIEGHTDDVPIRTRAFQSNWELSTARASTVIRFLIERVAFDPRRLSAAGYGEFHPRVANDSPANRARNRRVDIVIVETPS